MDVTSNFVDLASLKLHYLDYGNPSARPLLCIHGLSGNAHHFDGIARLLCDRWHVMALDVRGRGESGWGPPGDYNSSVYVNDLTAVLDALRIGRITLIGTSMGGIISMIFAGGYPDRVERLVLNDIGPEVDPAGLARINAYMGAAPSSFANLDEVITYYRTNYPSLRETSEAELREFVRWSVRPAADGSLVWKLDPAIRNPPRTGSAARPLDLWVPYTRITAPVLVVRGATSDILSRATTDRMRLVHRGTTVVEVPEVGHAPTLMEPAAIAAIQQFLA